jgi:hypothetical protein
MLVSTSHDSYCPSTTNAFPVSLCVSSHYNLITAGGIKQQVFRVRFEVLMAVRIMLMFFRILGPGRLVGR